MGENKVNEHLGENNVVSLDAFRRKAEAVRDGVRGATTRSPRGELSLDERIGRMKASIERIKNLMEELRGGETPS
jgi:hypothetical protein